MSNNIEVQNKWTAEAGRGFLPDLDPLDTLPAEFGLIDHAASNLGSLIRNGELRPLVATLQPIDVRSITDRRTLNALWRDYSMLASAYVFGRADEPDLHSIPVGIARPMYDLAARFDWPQILNYQAYVLDNFRIKNKSLPPDKRYEPENLEPIRTFSDADDPEHEGEKWFINLHHAAEYQAGKAIANLEPAQVAAGEGNEEVVMQTCVDIAASTQEMTRLIARMPERLVAKGQNEYSQTTRRFVFPFEGVVFEGVEELGEVPQHLAGETGGQSPFPRALGAFLGIQIPSSDMEMLAQHMHPDHKDFVDRLKMGCDVRQFVLDREAVNTPLTEAYNQAVLGLAGFRHSHKKDLAEPYLTHVDGVGGTRGTGTTPFNHYLTNNHVFTLRHKLP